jgi:hypothetical protein
MAAVLNRRDAESSPDAERSFGIAFRAAPDGAIQRFGELKKIGCMLKKISPIQPGEVRALVGWVSRRRNPPFLGGTAGYASLIVLRQNA